MPKIAEEWPWVYVVNDLYTRDYCHYCVRSCEDQLVCSACRYAVYCNSACQSKAWPDHRAECMLITRAGHKSPNSMVRLIARIVLKLNSGGAREESWFNTVLKSFQKRTFSDLISHRSKVFKDPIRTGNFAQYCYRLREYMFNERLPSSAGLMEIYGKVVVNSFSILNNDLNPVGLGVYLHLSQLDHTCDAENVVIFDGAKAYLNGLNESAINTELDLRSFTISYDSVICETEMRRRNLQNRYYFTCHCDRCLDQSIDSIATSTRCTNCACDGCVLIDESTASGKCDLCGNIVEDSWEAINLMVKSNKENDTLEERDPRKMNSEMYYQRAKELLLKQKKSLHPMNVHMIRTKCFLANAAYELKRVDEALVIYNNLRAYFNYYLPKNHPLLAINELSIARLCKELGNWLRAKRHFAKALQILEHSHGRDHTLYARVKKYLDCAMVQLQKMGIREDINLAAEDAETVKVRPISIVPKSIMFLHEDKTNQEEDQDKEEDEEEDQNCEENGDEEEEEDSSQGEGMNQGEDFNQEDANPETATAEA